jgi:hypothetical protein
MYSKQTIKLAVFALSGLALQSCTSASKYSSGKTLDITALINQRPTLADLDIKDVKATGTASDKSAIKNVEAIKQEAVANALKSVNADILVEPKFNIEVDNFTTSVIVTGYPGFYKNFRAVKTEDLQVLESTLFKGTPQSTTNTTTVPAPSTLNNILKTK